jgi:uncharacterized membrane protein
MKILAASIAIGSFLMIGAHPVMAGQLAFALGPSAGVQLAAMSDSKFDRETYAQQARDEIQKWQRKLQDFDEKMQAKGKQAGNAAGDDLKSAWIQAEAASRDLKTAGAEDWQIATASYERASHELAAAWRNLHPDGK